MDVLDWHRGRLSTRRLSVLIAHLPRDSAVNRALHGEAVEWGVTEHLLAAVTDHLAAANWMTSVVNGDPDAEQPEFPEPVPRPDTREWTGANDEPSPGDAAVRHSRPSAEELSLFFG
ncbi:hypothetical protein AB0K09_11800 [Streptomyces sp. NPDC049577]|uniref:hypothetical protein n=1 Tax=Streptomyces sp. NPDC049577 TaxID=3155153 RepID=UPI0034369374